MSERNYGIDFLRLILMFMICMLHVLSQGGIMDAVIETDIAYRYAIYSFLYVVSYCGVDGFALISGYAASDKNRKYTIIINMWFQAFFYSFILTVILTIMGYNDGVGMKDLIKAAMPVSFNVFWYFTGYFVLFFAMPVLNKYLFSIDILTAKKSLAVTVILFSFVGLISDAFKTNWGGGYFRNHNSLLYRGISKKNKLVSKYKGKAINMYVAAKYFNILGSSGDYRYNTASQE